MKYLKILLIVVIVAVLLFFSFKNVKFNEVKRIIQTINWIYPLIFFVGLYLQFFVRAYRWGLILKPHKKRISIWTLYNYTVIGFLLNFLPGKVGEAARGILLAGEEKINRSYGLASVVLERLIDMMMLLVLFIISLFVIPVSQNSTLLMSLKRISVFILPLLLFFFLLFYLLNTDKMFKIVEKIIRSVSKLAPERWREKLIDFSLSFVKGLRLDLSVWEYIKLLISSVVVWIFLIPFYWILMKGFAFGNQITLFQTIPYFCVLVVSAAIPTPGMAGSFDAASKLGLEQLYHVTPNDAAAYALLSHFLILAVMVIPGLIAFWAKGLHMSTIKGIKDQNDEIKNQENQDALLLSNKNNSEEGSNSKA